MQGLSASTQFRLSAAGHLNYLTTVVAVVCGLTLAGPSSNVMAGTVTLNASGTVAFRQHPSGAWGEGDSFTLTYSFDGGITGTDYSDNSGVIRYYSDPAATASLSIAGMTYTSQGAGFSISNDSLWGVDRYIATFGGVTEHPSGDMLNFIQLDFTDYSMAVLSDRSLVSSASLLNAFDDKSGRIVFLNNAQPQLAVTSITAVPEPSTYAMALAGLACGGFSMWRRRKRS